MLNKYTTSTILIIAFMSCSKKTTQPPTSNAQQQKACQQCGPPAAIQILPTFATVSEARHFAKTRYGIKDTELVHQEMKVEKKTWKAVVSKRGNDHFYFVISPTPNNPGTLELAIGSTQMVSKETAAATFEQMGFHTIIYNETVDARNLGFKTPWKCACGERSKSYGAKQDKFRKLYLFCLITEILPANSPPLHRR